MIPDVYDIPLEPQSGTSKYEETDIGAVVAGCIVAFDESVSQQHRYDVLSSLLFVQLAASAKAKRYTQWKTWYKQFHSVFEGIGWILRSNATPRRWSPQSEFVLDTPVLDTFGEIVMLEERLKVADAVTALRKDIEGRSQDIFNSVSHSGAWGNFQVAFVKEEDDEGVQLILGEFTFESPTSMHNLALEKLPSNTLFYAGLYNLELNEQAFSSGRKTIIERLGERYERWVAPLRVACFSETSEIHSNVLLSDPFGDNFDDSAKFKSNEKQLPGLFYEAPPIVESLILNDSKDCIHLVQEKGLDPHCMLIELQTPYQTPTYGSIIICREPIPQGEDMQEFYNGNHFLVQSGGSNDGNADSSGIGVHGSIVSPCHSDGHGYQKLLDSQTTHYINTMHAKNSLVPVSFCLDRGTVENSDLRLQFTRYSGFDDVETLPVEVLLRGGLGYVFRYVWESY